MTLHPWNTFRNAVEFLLTHRALWGLALLLGLTQSSAWWNIRTPSASTPGAEPAAMDCLSGLIVLVLAVVSLAATNSLLALATDQTAGGRMSLPAAWAQGWARWWPVFVFNLLLGLYLAVPLLLLVLLALLISGAASTTFNTSWASVITSWWYTVASLLITALLAPLTYLGQCRVAVAFQTPTQGLRRAWALYRAQPRSLVGLAILLAVLPGLLQLLPSLLLGLTGLDAPEMLAARLALWPLVVLLMGFASSWELVAWALAHLTLDPPPEPAAML